MNASTIMEIVKQSLKGKDDSVFDSVFDPDVDSDWDQRPRGFLALPVLFSLIDADTDLELLLTELDRYGVADIVLQYASIKYPELVTKFLEQSDLSPAKLGRYFNSICEDVPKVLLPTVREPIWSYIEKTILPYVKQFTERYPRILWRNGRHPLYELLTQTFPNIHKDWPDDYKSGVTVNGFEGLKNLFLTKLKYDVWIRNAYGISRKEDYPRISVDVPLDDIIKGVPLSLTRSEIKQIENRLESKERAITVFVEVELSQLNGKHTEDLAFKDLPIYPPFFNIKVDYIWFNWLRHTRDSTKELLTGYRNSITRWAESSLPTVDWLNANAGPTFIIDEGRIAVAGNKYTYAIDVITQIIEHVKNGFKVEYKKIGG